LNGLDVFADLLSIINDCCIEYKTNFDVFVLVLQERSDEGVSPSRKRRSVEASGTQYIQ